MNPFFPKKDLRDLCIALAGILQAVRLVQQTASGTRKDSEALAASLGSLLMIDSPSAETVYGGIHPLRLGLETLCEELNVSGTQRSTETMRYLITVMHLARKLNRNTAFLETIRSGIEKTRAQADYFELSHPNIIASLADVYKQTISKLHPRIMVTGEQGILSNPDNQNMIRTLLLAAMRAAVLWRQCGGNRITLVLQRKALVEQGDRLLREICTAV